MLDRKLLTYFYEQVNHVTRTSQGNIIFLIIKHTLTNTPPSQTHSPHTDRTHSDSHHCRLHYSYIRNSLQFNLDKGSTSFLLKLIQNTLRQLTSCNHCKPFISELLNVFIFLHVFILKCFFIFFPTATRIMILSTKLLSWRLFIYRVIVTVTVTMVTVQPGLVYHSGNMACIA